MKFIYTTQEDTFPFRKVGGELTDYNTVELTDAGYQEFLTLTEGTTHRLELYKETAPWKT
jgi:hypothetical protein